jgi:hypothetical protein
LSNGAAMGHLHFQFRITARKIHYVEL